MLKDNLPNSNIVKNEYLDWIITDVYIGKEEKKDKNNLFL